MIQLKVKKIIVANHFFKSVYVYILSLCTVYNIFMYLSHAVKIEREREKERERNDPLEALAELT